MCVCVYTHIYIAKYSHNFACIFVIFTGSPVSFHRNDSLVLGIKFISNYSLRIVPNQKPVFWASGRPAARSKYLTYVIRSFVVITESNGPLVFPVHSVSLVPGPILQCPLRWSFSARHLSLFLDQSSHFSSYPSNAIFNSLVNSFSVTLKIFQMNFPRT